MSTGIDFSGAGAFGAPALDPDELRRRQIAMAATTPAAGAPMPGSPSAQDIATDQGAEAGHAPVSAAPALPTPQELVAMMQDKATKSALSTNSSTTTKLSPEFKAAGVAEVDALAAEKPLVKEAGELQAANAGAQQDAAAGNLAAVQQQQRDQAELTRVHDEIRAKKQAALDDAIQAHQAATPGDFWASQPGGDRIQSSVAIALGQLGAGLQGTTHNAALEILNRRQDQWYATEKMKIDKAKDNVLMARAGVKDADEARQIAETNLGARYILGLEATKAQLAQGLAAQGKDQARVDAALKAAGIDEKIAAKRVELTTPTNKQVTGSFNGPSALQALDGAVKAAAVKGKAAGLGGNLSIFDPATGEQLGDARTVRDLAVATKTLEATHIVKTDVKNLRDFYAVNQGVLWSPEKKETLETLRNTLTGHLLQMNNQAGSDFKIKFDAGMVPHAGDIFALNQNPTPKLDVLDNEIAHIRDTTLRARGITTSPSVSDAVGNPTGAPAHGASPAPARPAEMHGPDGKIYRLQPDGTYL